MINVAFPFRSLYDNESMTKKDKDKKGAKKEEEQAAPSLK